MGEVKRGSSVGFRLRWTFQGLRTTQGSSLESGCFVAAKRLGVEIRFNPMDAYDKRYFETFV